MRRAIIIAAVLASCSDGSKPPTPLPPSASGWSVQFSQGANPLVDLGNGAWYIDFPTCDDCKLDQVVTPINRALTGNITAVISTQILTGAPVFDYKFEPTNTCDYPAHTRLYVQQKGDNFSGQGEYEFYRCWARDAAFRLDQWGQVTLTESVTKADAWSSVHGKTGDEALAEFTIAMANVGVAGFVFGGGCFYGHGVRTVGGTARFNMGSFSAQ